MLAMPAGMVVENLGIICVWLSQFVRLGGFFQTKN